MNLFSHENMPFFPRKIIPIFADEQNKFLLNCGNPLRHVFVNLCLIQQNLLAVDIPRFDLCQLPHHMRLSVHKTASPEPAMNRLLPLSQWSEKEEQIFFQNLSRDFFPFHGSTFCKYLYPEKIFFSNYNIMDHNI